MERMQLVLDSNRLFAALIRDSVSRKILLHFNADFFIITLNYEELQKYKTELFGKSGMDAISFNLMLNQLLQKCIYVEDRELFKHWDEAKEIMLKIDPEDVAFTAAALATGADIWSDDEHFQKQNKINIWKTKDLVKFV